MPHHPDSAPAFALFDDNLDASSAGAWLLTGLVEEIRCTDPDAWPAALARLEKAAKDGAWVALAARYELGYAIEPRLRPLLPAGDEALVTGWIFAHGEWLSDAAVDAWLAKMAGDAPGGVGTGLYGLLVLAIIAVFVGGLLGPLAPANRDLKGSAAFTTPWIATLGARWQATDKLFLTAEYSGDVYACETNIADKCQRSVWLEE